MWRFYKMSTKTNKKNDGKIFEEEFKKSVPADCYCYRLKDNPLAYMQVQGVSYTHDNPCDFFVYDGKHGKFYALELKSTTNLAFTVQATKEESKKMIKYNQIEGLNKIAAYPNIVAGFMFCFIDKQENPKDTTQEFYFLDIASFNNMMESIDKHSCNKQDIIDYGAICVNARKLQVNYRLDLEELFYYCAFGNI